MCGATFGRRGVIGGTRRPCRSCARAMCRVIAGAIGYWAFDNAVLWATFKAVGVRRPDHRILMGYLIGQLGGLLPMPGGMGGIDGGLIGTLSSTAHPPPPTGAAVLAYRVILFWLPLVGGAIAFALAAARTRARRPRGTQRVRNSCAFPSATGGSSAAPRGSPLRARLAKCLRLLEA